MKVWITKYALTTGIIETEAEECGYDMIHVPGADVTHSYYHKEGKEWHRTKEAAITRAQEMRRAKISSLKKQIDKLEKMSIFSEGKKWQKYQKIQ